MKLNITREWLARWLARADDTTIGAGGSDLQSLKQDVELRIFRANSGRLCVSCESSAGGVLRIWHASRTLTYATSS